MALKDFGEVNYAFLIFHLCIYFTITKLRAILGGRGR
uniref:Uncharacterized protein n=1 Tax=Anguilla anguilla TaxID=7936 RepID=A0A0E9VCC7_ANGAN